jgi:hypothetical protein
LVAVSTVTTITQCGQGTSQNLCEALNVFKVTALFNFSAMPTAQLLSDLMSECLQLHLCGDPEYLEQ